MLVIYKISVEVTNKWKLFSAEHTVHDSALQTQQKTKSETCSVLQIFTQNFYSQCWTGSFLVTSWLLGWYRDWPVLYNFRGGCRKWLLRHVWEGCWKTGSFCYVWP